MEAVEQHVLPDLRGDVPVLDDAILVHVVADLDTLARDKVLIAKEVLAGFAIVYVEGREDRFGRVFAREAGAGDAVARVEDDGGDLIWEQNWLDREDAATKGLLCEI